MTTLINTLCFILCYATPWKSNLTKPSCDGWFADLFGIGFAQFCLVIVGFIITFFLPLTGIFVLPLLFGGAITIVLFYNGHWLLGIVGVILTIFTTLATKSERIKKE
jgi:hypothetical protein